MDATQAVGIVGLGAVSGYGWGVDSLWSGLLSGKSAAQPVAFDGLTIPNSLSVHAMEGCDGDAEGYLGHAAREGRLLVADDPIQAKERLLADWWSAAGEGNLREVVMLAHRRADQRLFQRAGSGSFPALLRGVTVDPAMLVWLDGRDNTRRTPNENYGREVMERFGPILSIGVAVATVAIRKIIESKNQKCK